MKSKNYFPGVKSRAAITRARYYNRLIECSNLGTAGKKVSGEPRGISTEWGRRAKHVREIVPSLLYSARRRGELSTSIARAFSQKKSFVKIARVPAFLSFELNGGERRWKDAATQGTPAEGERFEFHSRRSSGRRIWKMCLPCNGTSCRILFIIHRVERQNWKGMYGLAKRTLWTRELYGLYNAAIRDRVNIFYDSVCDKDRTSMLDSD